MDGRKPLRPEIRGSDGNKGTQAILLQDVEKLGRKGDVVNVTPGYLRNYLGPRKLALAASDARVAQVRRQEDMRRRHEAQSEEQAAEMAHTLNRTVLTIKARAGVEDKLYGSVTSTDVADAIWTARSSASTAARSSSTSRSRRSAATRCRSPCGATSTPRSR